MFHVVPYGETTVGTEGLAITSDVDAADATGATGRLSDFEAGFLVGILVGEGHFGGDGRQAQVTLRMHTDHAALFHWLVDRMPGSRLYGPYHHGGRSYYQWMARGECLRERLVPLLERRLTPALDERAWRRFRRMCADYPGVRSGVPPSA